MKEEEVAAVRVPLGWLYRRRKADGLTKENLEFFSARYSDDAKRNIYHAVMQVLEHPEVDVLALMPYLPYTNDELRRYLVAVRDAIKPVVEALDGK